MSAPTTPRGVGGRTGGRGIPLNFERGPTSKDRLRVDWLHPVPPERTGEQTAASGALSFAEAIDVLWGNGDDRPLLVMRECMSCIGRDDALLSQSLSNDRVMLLTKWFRTVRLPVHVTLPSHPFANVFNGHAYKNGTPHFFLLAQPNGKPLFFNGQQTQSDLVKGFHDVLGLRYAKDAQKAVKAWLQVLDTFDTLDARRRQLEDQLSQVRATDGPDSAKAEKISTELKQTTREREENLAREVAIRDLGLLPMPRTAAVGAAAK